MKFIHTRSIPNVGDDRLREAIMHIHNRTHTVYGLLAWDQPRRQLVNLGMKAHAITDEMRRRGMELPTCTFCVRQRPRDRSPDS